MLFNSLVFILFFLLFLAGWHVFRHRQRPRWAWLTAMSMVFYGWWDWRFVLLIIGSGLIDFVAAWAMMRSPRHRKLYLVLSLLGNLGSLAIFKYSGFIAHALEDGAALLGLQWSLYERLPPFTLILPVGISFFTFQSMSYTIDVYRGQLKPVKSFLHFMSYLVMFPQLVAGPIVRARDMLHQLATDRPIRPLGAWIGLKQFVYGLFQKTVLADNLAYFVDSVYGGTYPAQGALIWWLATAAFAAQIYCDFSGYSLMANGLARMMGYRFKMNFAHPYRSISFKEFWSRWHISLSTWFRDYLYIPLGGGRAGMSRGMVNMGITMVVSGFWHGANWTFLAWGALHALFLAVERMAGGWWRRTIPRRGLRASISFLLVLGGVLLSWVFFRASSIKQALGIMGHMLSSGTDLSFVPVFKYHLVFLFLVVAVETVLFRFNRGGALNRLLLRRPVLDGVVMGLIMLIAVYFRGPEAAFIYFQF